jgi:hypothetical protein
MIGRDTGSDTRELTASPTFERPGPERWFFTALACAMIATAIAGFLPSLVNGSERRAPLTPLAAAHGVMFFAWLLIFLVQARLVAGRRIRMHRRVGLAAACVAAVMIPLGYATCIAMVRRGFDLSGDLKIGHDPAFEVIFPLGDILLFAVLFIAAVAYRGRPDMHKRLILFANIALMPAPLAHLIGHVPRLAAMPPTIIVLPIAMFLAAAVAREYFVLNRVYPLTWAIAGGMLVSGSVRASVIGPSAAWHHLVNWLAR